MDNSKEKKEMGVITPPNIEELVNMFYLEKMGKYNEILKDFNTYYNSNISSHFKILTYFIDEELSVYDFENIDLNVKFDTIKKTVQRLSKDNLISEVRLHNKTKYYRINESGKEYIKNHINKDFIEKSNYIINNIRINRNHKIKEAQESPEFSKERVMEVMELLDSRDNIEQFVRDGFFVFDLMEILEIDTELGEFIISDFTSAYSLFKTCLKDKIPEISKYKDNCENIKFINLDKIKTQQYNIASIPKKSNEFINTKGILLKRNTQIKEEVTKLYYLCTNPSCPFSEENLKVSGGKIKSCPKCKSSVDLVDRKIKRFVDLEIKDIDNDTSLKVKAYDNLIEGVCNLKIGEEISVNGFIKLIETKNQSTNEVILNRMMILNNFKSSSNSVYLNKEEEEEVVKKLEELKNNNILIKDYLLEHMRVLYPFHPQNILDLYLIPQILKYDSLNENIIHILGIGGPNTYKTSFLKYFSYIFPKPKQLLFSLLSVDKFYGGVKADGLTDVGLAMTQRGGSLIIDEIDKDTDSYEKSSNMLNQVMSDQEANKERVGASIHLKNINLRIYGLMNHHIKYKDSPEKIIQWINKNIHDSTLTRFFLINYDYFITREVKNNINKKLSINNNLDLSKENFDMKKNIIIYLRNKLIDLSQIEKKINEFLEIISNSFEDQEHLTRNIQQIRDIIVGICRLKGIDIATEQELEEAKELILYTYKTQGLTFDKYLKILNETVNNKNQEDLKITEEKTKQKELLELLDIRQSISYEDLQAELQIEKDQLNTMIEKLKKEGMIYEPRSNQLRRVE